MHLPVLRMLSARLEDLSDDQREERRARISRCRKIAYQIAQGKRLATDRDCGKRKFFDMYPTEQEVLEDFDCGRLHRRRDTIQTPRGSAFRSQRPSAGSAAEHATASSSTTDKKK